MRSLLTCIVAMALGSAACSSSGSGFSAPEQDNTDVDATAEDALAASSCGSNYAKALVSYKRAVSRAQSRVRKGACNDLSATDPGLGTGMAYEIAGDMNEAIQACGDFRRLLRDSVYAKPVRDAIGGTLRYYELTGQLEASSGRGLSGVQNGGLSNVLKQGLTVYSLRGGALGNIQRIVFKGTGDAILSNRVAEDDPAHGLRLGSWSDQKGKYTVSGKVITVTFGAASTRLELGIEPQVKEISLRPSNDNIELMTSFEQECEA